MHFNLFVIIVHMVGILAFAFCVCFDHDIIVSWEAEIHLRIVGLKMLTLDKNWTNLQNVQFSISLMSISYHCAIYYPPPRLL